MTSFARPAATLTAASVTAAGLGWVTLVLVGRLHGPATYAGFTVWWSCYFAAASVLVGLQQVTAASQLERTTEPGDRWRGLAALAVPLGLLAWLAVGLLAPEPSVEQLVLLLPVTLAGVTVLVLASETLGLLTAQARWTALGLVTAADAALRLGAVLLFVALWPQPAGYVAGVVASVVVFTPLFARGDWRFGPVGFGGPGFLPRAAAAMAGAGCLGVLSVGMPAAVQVTGSGAVADTAPLFATLVLLRSPVLVLTAAVRPLVLHHVAESGGSGPRPSWLVLGAAAVALGAAGSWVLGPPVVTLLFGAEFEPNHIDAAAVGSSGVLLGLSAMTGTGLVARGRDHGALLGWVLAVLVTVVVLALPLTFSTRTDLALLAGPALGLAVHLGAYSRR